MQLSPILLVLATAAAAVVAAPVRPHLWCSDLFGWTDLDPFLSGTGSR